MIQLTDNLGMVIFVNPSTIEVLTVWQLPSNPDLLVRIQFTSGLYICVRQCMKEIIDLINEHKYITRLNS